jgi:hypothetical protein
MYLAGITLTCKHSNGSTAIFKVAWRNTEKTNFPPQPQFFSWGMQPHPEMPDNQNYTIIYIADTVDEIRIYPDIAEFEFSILEIHLLTVPRQFTRWPPLSGPKKHRRHSREW